ALATLALRVTASMVTALGPPDRSSAVAASSKRARERAGRGSLLRVVIVYLTSNEGKQDYRSRTETLESIHRRSDAIWSTRSQRPLRISTPPSPPSPTALAYGC